MKTFIYLFLFSSFVFAQNGYVEYSNYKIHLYTPKEEIINEFDKNIYELREKENEIYIYRRSDNMMLGRICFDNNNLVIYASKLLDNFQNNPKAAFNLLVGFLESNNNKSDNNYLIFPDSRGLDGYKSKYIATFKTRKEAETKLRELNIPYLLNDFEFEGAFTNNDNSNRLKLLLFSKETKIEAGNYETMLRLDLLNDKILNICIWDNGVVFIETLEERH